ncbi:Asp-tRNA(Asn)/Glu-tRNA(Gln) amidotransferase subunit GatB [Patescibacteria group bacterium]
MSESIFGKYKLVLGLEIHLHLKTDRKMFCRCDADVYGKEPNTHTCPTCLGLPGALPVPNPEAIKKTQILGLALNSEINKDSRFDRKHYFYPDLPKGYQISQYKQPFCVGGHLELSNGKKAEIERVHLEEDTAKSMHEGDKTLVDFNLSSMPLVEIVTKPTFTTIEDAVEFSKKIQSMVRELGLGDTDMEKGQMRLEPNISLRTQEMEDADELPEYKVEIKNINSFRFMEKAVTAEVIRQRELLESGETPIQENRGYNEEKKTTVGQRSKEQAHDYRYFPEPDIPPMEFDKDYLDEVEKEFKELEKNLIKPEEKSNEIKENYNLA